MTAVHKWQNGKNQGSSGSKSSKHNFCKPNRNENLTDEEDDIDNSNKDKNNEDDHNHEENKQHGENEDDDDDAEEMVSQKNTERVSDKNNVTITIVDLFLADAPATELLGTLEAAIKMWWTPLYFEV